MEVKKGLYRLRNGIVVETGRDDRAWQTCGVYVISIPEGQYDVYWGIGEHHCLVWSDMDRCSDPLSWKGGSHGQDYDVMEELPGDN